MQLMRFQSFRTRKAKKRNRTKILQKNWNLQRKFRAAKNPSIKKSLPKNLQKLISPPEVMKLSTQPSRSLAYVTMTCSFRVRQKSPLQKLRQKTNSKLLRKSSRTCSFPFLLKQRCPSPNLRLNMNSKNWHQTNRAR